MIPRLIHPVNVVIRRMNSADTLYDVDAAEPVGNVATFTDVTIPAQIGMGDSAKLSSTAAGPAASAGGYILVRRIDLQARGIDLAIGDRITSLGHEAVNVYIDSLEPTAHYPDQGGWTMIKAFFSDRSQARV